MIKAGLLRRAHDGVRLLGNGELKAKVAVFGVGRVQIRGRRGRKGRRLGHDPRAQEGRDEQRNGGLTPI